MRMASYSNSPWSLAAVFATALALTAPSAYAMDYYQAFGQKAGISAVVNTFVGRVAADNRINGYFAHANIPALKAGLINQFCQLLDGPCVYKGPNMRVAHKGLGVTQSAFNALTEDLVWAMNARHIPLGAQNRLIRLLAPMESEIVTR